MFGLQNAILFSHRHLHKCIETVYTSVEKKLVPSYEDPCDPCEIPVFASS